LASVDLKKKKILIYDCSQNYTCPTEKIHIQKRISSFFDYYLNLKLNYTNSYENLYKTPIKKIKSKDIDYSLSSKTFANTIEFLSYKSSTCSKDSYKNNFLSNNLDLNHSLNKIYEEKDGMELVVNISSNFNSEASSCTDEPSSQEDYTWKYKEAKCPLQNNENDGGVFICKMIDFLSRGEHITFSREDINYFRLSMAIELIESKLLSS
jgi:hypothetical protein